MPDVRRQTDVARTNEMARAAASDITLIRGAVPERAWCMPGRLAPTVCRLTHFPNT